jgi:hypothetical protein
VSCLWLDALSLGMGLSLTRILRSCECTSLLHHFLQCGLRGLKRLLCLLDVLLERASVATRRPSSESEALVLLLFLHEGYMLALGSLLASDDCRWVYALEGGVLA